MTANKAAPGGEWRVGRRVPIHVYEGERPLGTFLRAEDAARAVAAVNATPAAETAPDAGLVEALKEIAKGEGRFSRDPYEHACNTIEDMKEIARAALSRAGERT